MRKAYLTPTLLVALTLGVLALACDVPSFSLLLKSTATPTATSTTTPTSVPISYDGLWDGGTISDASVVAELQFYVQNNRVTEIGFNYTLRSGGCMLMSSISKKVDQAMTTGKDFTAGITDSQDAKQLAIAGTFSSSTEASGTFEFKGTMEDCGEFDKKGKWTANTIPVPPTRTPTLPAPTATQPRATPTRSTLTTTTPEVLATPGSTNVPSAWATLMTVRFSIMVPSSFQAQVSLRDVRLKPDSAQLILMGEDPETNLQIDVTETPALFGNAQRKLENRKGDFNYSSEPTTILKAQTGITVNGRDAAILEYSRSGLAAVECFIVAGQEEFDIIIKQGNPNDANFIATAERIANSFTVDATPNATPPR